MKQILLLAALALGGATALAQKQENRNINGFSAINIQNGIEVHYTQGANESVTVEYPDGVVARDLVTDCYGSELKIYTKDGGTASGAKVFITHRNLTNITVGSGASFKTEGTVEAGDITVTLATGGQMEGTLHCAGTCALKTYTAAVARATVIAARLKCDVTGGATVRLDGRAEFADVFCSGGTLLAAKFTAAKADIAAKKNSAVLMHVQHSVKADADGSSAITYYGKPETIRVNEASYVVKKN